MHLNALLRSAIFVIIATVSVAQSPSAASTSSPSNAPVAGFGLANLLSTFFKPGGAGNSFISAWNGIIVIRLGYAITNAWFDALAPYNTVAIGLHSSIPKVANPSTITDVNKEVSALYATRVVLNSLIVTTGFSAALDTYLSARIAFLTGNTPNFATDSLITDQTNPIGIGNVAGNGVVLHLINDGINQLGNLGGHQYNKQRYSDYTGYQPVNPDGYLNDPRFWQPTYSDDGFGTFTYQEHIVPQLSLVPGLL